MLNHYAINKEMERGSIYVDGAQDKLGENFINVTLGDSIKIYDSPSLDVRNPMPIE